MNPKPVILFRKEIDMEGELDIARQHMPLFEYRSTVPENSLVVGRYSVLPFYKELQEEIELKGSHLINSYSAHSYIANIMDWAGPNGVLRDLTPRTWHNWVNLPDSTSFVLKGRTNSRKQKWNTHMFAASKNEVPVIASRLLEDELITDQGVVVREYVPLRKIQEGLNGLPITNEWRTFWVVGKDEQVVCVGTGFYWKMSHPEAETSAFLPLDVVEGITYQAAKLISTYANFFVIDVAETLTGEWIVIEVNDGQMSGLCGVDPHKFYSSLAKALG